MSTSTECDILLVGAGIMSTTLASLLHELDPTLSIHIYEQLDSVAAESSAVENNAGTGHSAFCELNYTPESQDGSINITKAIAIAESFEVSKQFRASLVEKGYISDPKTFINPVAHCSVVFGKKDVMFLKPRYEAMRETPLFKDMVYSDTHEHIRKRMPLIMDNRSPTEEIAATYMSIGTDMNFGGLTRGIMNHLIRSPHIRLYLEHQVSGLQQQGNKKRTVTVQDKKTHEQKTITAGFVFIGAGGAALTLLQKSGITERKGLGGFPVSGQRLMCTNPEVIKKHHTKVYGKAALGAPPMSVPLLDTRIINGKKTLLFGPYAGFTTKFLQHGSLFDLFKSLKRYNILSMLGAGLHNIPLTKYLIGQVIQTHKQRVKALRDFIPNARLEDRILQEAGYRVQIIKPDAQQGGVLQFGTEVVISHDHTLATLLGASPGASTSVDIMLHVIKSCFPEHFHNDKKIKELIPSYGKKLNEDEQLLINVRNRTQKILGI